MQPTVPRADAKKVLLRLPHGLHAELKQKASHEGVSLNTLLATLLAGSVAWQGPHRSPRAARTAGGVTATEGDSDAATQP